MHNFPALSFGFWQNIVASSPYTNKIFVNFRLDGNPTLMAGNVNQDSINYATGTVPRVIYADLIDFQTGLATGISMSLTDLGAAMDISGDSSSTTNFGTNAYIRGVRVLTADSVAVQFGGAIANNAPYRITGAIYVTASISANQLGEVEVTNGASVITEAVDCTNPVETSQIEAIATDEGGGAGLINFKLTADNIANNAVGLCCLLLEI